MKKITVEIIKAHPSLSLGSKRLLPVATAKALVKSGFAKIVNEDEFIPPTEVPDFKPKDVEKEIVLTDNKKEDGKDNIQKPTGNKKSGSKKRK